MKVASLVYSCDSGLGSLARAFVDHGIITHPYVVRHAHHQTHDGWFPGAPQGHIRSLNEREIQRHLADCDAALFLETPFLWNLVPFCRERGIRTLLCPMYECEPEQLPYVPDGFICPSLLDLRYYPDRSVFIPVPVEVPWRLRERAEVFVHHAGHGGLLSRNGTGDLLDAMRHVRSPVKLIVRTQRRLQWDVTDPRIEVRVGSVPYEQLWRDGGEGDVFVFPERHNGLSLPLQEAHASGMAVLAGDRFPMNTWLPRDLLVPPVGYERQRISGRCNEFDSARYDPKAIAAMIDKCYWQDIKELSLRGKEYATANSWANLKERYVEAINGIGR